MNFYDSEKMSDLLMNHGYATTDTQEDADLIIVNTCHIREKASEKLFSDLGRIKKIKDKKRLTVAVTGCVAQAEGEQISARAPFVDLITGPQSYHRLPEMLRQIANGKSISPLLEFMPNEKFDNLEFGMNKKGPTSFVSIQEGCDKFCTFCVVPYTRGAEFSRSVSEIIDEVNNLTDHGVIEVTLLGQNVNSWHGVDYKGKERGLAYLINEISNIKKIKRIRYTTSHPLDMDEELILAHKNLKKLMPYLHLPVQSGSDKILSAMNRKHTAKDYIRIIDKIRKINPEIALSGDFIVGFPGETKQDHHSTINLIKEINYSQAYSFKYSKRPGTPASVFLDHVNEDTKKYRLYEVQELLRSQQLSFNKRTINTTMKVLVLKKGKKQNQYIGRSPYNQSVYFSSKNKNMIGSLIDLNITDAFQNSLTGNILSDF